MLSADNPFYRQVVLLVELLPLVAREPCFALKGGTAINLFVRDLPRLSVDIDLTYLPIEDREARRGYFTPARNISPSMLVRDSQPIDRIGGQGDSRSDRTRISLESDFRFSEIFVAPKVARLVKGFISTAFFRSRSTDYA